MIEFKQQENEIFNIIPDFMKINNKETYKKFITTETMEDGRKYYYASVEFTHKIFWFFTVKERYFVVSITSTYYRLDKNLIPHNFLKYEDAKKKLDEAFYRFEKECKRNLIAKTETIEVL